MKRATEGRCCSESPSPIPPENHLRPALSPHGKTKPKTQLKETCVSSGITLEDHAKPASSVSMCAMCAIGVPAGGDLWVNCYLHCVEQKMLLFACWSIYLYAPHHKATAPRRHWGRVYSRVSPDPSGTNPLNLHQTEPGFLL